MAIPERYHLDAVTKLKGDALVTFPGAEITIKKVERVWTTARGSADTILAYLTADTEHTTALLTEQYIIGGDQQTVMVYRLYETLPGVDLVEYGVDPETLLETARLTRRVAYNAPTAFEVGDLWNDDTLSGGVNLQSWRITDIRRSPASVVVRTEVFDLIHPDIDGFTRTEYRSVGFQFPAIFTFLAVSEWAIPNPPWTIQGPFPGIDYELTTQRSASKPAEVVYTYSEEPSGSVPNTWTVTTPGAASRIFPIGQNTIHNAIEVFETQSATTQQVEDLPASDPTSYTAGSTDCIIQASEERWRGNIFRKVVVTVTE